MSEKKGDNSQLELTGHKRRPDQTPFRGGRLLTRSKIIRLGIMGLVSYCVSEAIPQALIGRIGDPIEPPEQGNLVGEGAPRIRLAYHANLANPRVRANVEGDINYVRGILKDFPILGYPLVSLSAQERYGYNFQAVNKDNVGVYYRSINQLFLNMEGRDTYDFEHLILHELGHYLSVKQNRQNLAPYLTPEVADQAEQAEEDLLNQIRRYEQIRVTLTTTIDFYRKLESKTPITWDDIVTAANVYPADIWLNSKKYLQFEGDQNPDPKEVRRRADAELYAEFTALLLQAQRAGLYDPSFQQPVYKILADFKASQNKIKSKSS